MVTIKYPPRVLEVFCPYVTEFSLLDQPLLLSVPVIAFFELSSSSVIISSHKYFVKADSKVTSLRDVGSI